MKNSKWYESLETDILIRNKNLTLTAKCLILNICLLDINNRKYT